MHLNEQKRILIVAPYTYPEGGGLEVYAWKVAQGLKNYNPVIISLTKNKSEDKIINGIRVIKKHANFIISNTPIRFSFLFEILKIIKKEKIDFIHAHTPVPFAADMAALASTLLKKPLLITYHAGQLLKGIFLIDFFVKIYILIEHFTLKQTKEIIVVSPHIKNEKRMKHFLNKIKVITPGVEINEFFSSSNYQENLIFTVCPLKKNYLWKGLENLLSSLAIVQKEIPNIQLNIAGEKGDYYDYYRELAEKLGVEKNVTFLGKISQTEMKKNYQESAVIIVPSTSNTEGTPTVLFEAGASGRPVIASRVGGIPYIINDGENGLLVEPNNSQEMAEKIIWLLKDKKKIAMIGEKAKEKIVNYDWKIISEKYEEIFNNNF
jgi:glycosyltransferase involved in cell wall biosynthesis